MQIYELETLINSLYQKNKESWEQTRLLAYIVAQVNSSKKLKPSDILSFVWDNEGGGNTSISNEDIERLKRKAKQYTNKYNG